LTVEYRFQGQDFTFTPPPWTGRAKQMTEMWRLLKGPRTAVCTMWNHRDGAEVRCDVDGKTRRSHASRDIVELLTRVDAWRVTYAEKG
jgi:hypothetical protein